MNIFRSSLFAVLFYSSTILLGVVYIPLMALPRRAFSFMARIWVRSVLAIVEGVAGIRYELRGRENLPPGPFIVASKHQSAWDTLIYNVLFKNCAYVMKRELFWVPFFGWLLWRARMIGVDRGGGARALRSLVSQAKERLAAGRSVIIFPQGTRTPPGSTRPYLPGVAALYKQAGVPVVPVALNSGLFWPRRRFVKFPGRIIIEILPPIPPGLDRKAFGRLLRERIEPATRRLEDEARARFETAVPPLRETARP